MKKISVIHCADIHYDADSSLPGRKGRTRCEERRSSFEKIIDMCCDESIDYLLIAGDLFDCPEPDKKLVERVRDLFSRCSETRVYIAPGNHDYVSMNSFYLKKNFWSDNVYIFCGDFECVEEENVCVCGAAFTSAYQEEGLMAEQEEYEGITLGVLHGDVQSESRYNPITKSDIVNSGIDYLALGHIHKRTQILKEGCTCYSYCGCHDGNGFDETGEKGIYKGTVWHGGCDMEFIPLSTREYIKMKVDITGLDESEVVSAVMSQQNGREDNIYDISLTGTRMQEYPLNEEQIKLSLAMFYSNVHSCYGYSIDYESMAEEQSYKGMFVRNILEKADDIDSDILDRALQIGILAMSGEVKYRED